MVLEEELLVKYSNNNDGDAWQSLLKMMKEKLAEDTKENEAIAKENAELQATLAKLEKNISAGEDISIDISVDVKVRLETERRELEEEIAQLKLNIKEKSSQIEENKIKIVTENETLVDYQKKLEKLITEFEQFTPDSILEK